MLDIHYNQAMIAQLCKSTPNSVSRFIGAQKIEPIGAEGTQNKRYGMDSIRQITQSLYVANHPPIRQAVHVFYNFKGGTGKTSLCYQVATHLAVLGYRVLALDLDPQGHLSHMMNIPEDWQGPTIYDVMINNVPIEETINNIMLGLDLIPANISMTRIEVPLSSKTKREEKLSQHIQPLRSNYDFIIMDTNPTISTLNMNALVASDKINIVCETQPLSLNGLRILVDEMLNFFDDMRISRGYTIIPNKYEIKTATAQEVLGALRSDYPNNMMSSVVRKAEEINLAAKKHLPVSAFCRSKSIAFEDVLDLVHEFVQESGK